MAGYVYQGNHAGLDLFDHPPRYRKKKPPPKPIPPLQPCGTRAAARRHERRKEKLCEPCKKAVRDYRNSLKRRG